ncbi:MAG: hypothetical protein NZ898_13945 [Myxococcota bacterium]|nr:hypothetical protein [Myxococcota bacterium]MDW8363701.1 hypothetical protein [Myxococcales bacterium]
MAVVVALVLALGCETDARSPGVYRRLLAEGAYRVLPWRSFRGPDERGWALVRAVEGADASRGPLVVVSEDGGERCRTREPVQDAWPLALLDEEPPMPLRFALIDRGTLRFADGHCEPTGPAVARLVALHEAVVGGRLVLVALDREGVLWRIDPWGEAPEPDRLHDGVVGLAPTIRPELVTLGTGRQSLESAGLPLSWARTATSLRLIDLNEGRVVRELGDRVRRVVTLPRGGVMFDDAAGTWIVETPAAEAALVEPGGCEADGPPGPAGYLVLAPCGSRTLVRVRAGRRQTLAEGVERFWRTTTCEGPERVMFTRRGADGTVSTWVVAREGTEPVPVPIGPYAVLRRQGGRCLVQTADRRIGWLEADALVPIVGEVTGRWELRAGEGSFLLQHGVTDGTGHLSLLHPDDGSLEPVASGVVGVPQSVGADFDTTGVGYVRDHDPMAGGGTLEARLFVLDGSRHRTRLALALDAPVADMTLTLGFHLYGILYTVSSGDRQGLWLAAE